MKETKAQFVLAATDPSSFPRDQRAEVAFLGRSNVGKSSLLNSLLGVRGLARTSSTPGRTQSINFFLIEQSFYFVDLPGYGYAKTSKEKRRAWGELIERYLAERPQLVLSILLVDARHEPTLSDRQMKSWLQHHGLPFWVVCTKVDKLSANERRKAQQQAMAALGTDRVISYSSITREGSSQVWEVIRSSVTRSN
jgi:GTP-binding protein